MADNLQTTFANRFSWMKTFEFQIWFNWKMFLWDEFIIIQYWFWAMAWWLTDKPLPKIMWTKMSNAIWYCFEINFLCVRCVCILYHYIICPHWNVTDSVGFKWWPWHTYYMLSVSWLLITWQCNEPWHQQAWHWPGNWLTHWGRDKMPAFSHTPFWHAFF